MNQQNEIVSKYRAVAEDILKSNDKNIFLYHTIDHTRAVVKAFNEIGNANNFSDKELLFGEIAAWFHDTGYSKDINAHELASVAIFKSNVDGNDLNDEEIEIIAELILSTKMPQNPKTEVQKALCDADIHHIGTTRYLENAALLKQELENLYGRPIDANTWRLENYNFLISHKFYTAYAKEKYNEQKNANIDQLKAGIKGFAKQDKQIKKLESQVAKLSAKLENKPIRGIETMFRTTSRNHIQLSAMADSKANIMISVNTIVLSLVLSIGIGITVEYPIFIVPIVSLILVTLTTIVLAILATRPHVSKGTFSRQDILNKKTNLLFFGNFHGMDIEDYQWGVNEMMNDADYLYSSLTRDIFFLGKVLGLKYRLLRAAYNTFMIGLILSTLLFILAGLRNTGII